MIFRNKRRNWQLKRRNLHGKAKRLKGNDRKKGKKYNGKNQTETPLASSALIMTKLFLVHSKDIQNYWRKMRQIESSVNSSSNLLQLNKLPSKLTQLIATLIKVYKPSLKLPLRSTEKDRYFTISNMANCSNHTKMLYKSKLPLTLNN